MIYDTKNESEEIMNTVVKSGGHIGRNWGWMLAFGILLVIAGVFAIVHPVATGLAISVILAITLMFCGVGSLFAAFNDAGWRAKSVDVVFGVLAVAGAIICLVDPFNGVTSIVWAIGIMFLLIGINELINGFRADQDKGWLILMGLVDVAIGIWISVFLGPVDALFLLAALVGFAFMFRGILLSVLAFRVRDIARS